MRSKGLILILILSFVLAGAAQTYSSWNGVVIDTSETEGIENIYYIITAATENDLGEKGELTTDEINGIFQIIECGSNDIGTIGECKNEHDINLHLEEDFSNADISITNSDLAPSELQDAPGFSHEWTRSDLDEGFCSEDKSGFDHDGDKWYYCNADIEESADDWEKEECDIGVDPSENGKCEEAVDFELERNGNQYSVSSNIYDVEGGELEFSRPGQSQSFELTGTDNPPDTVTLVSPDFGFSVSDRFVSVSDSVSIDLNNMNGLGSDYDDGVEGSSFNIVHGEGGVSSGLGNAEVDQSTSGEVKVEASVVDNAPGDGIRSFRNITFWSGDGLVRDYVASTRGVEDNWQIMEGDEERDSIEYLQNDVVSFTDNYGGYLILQTNDKDSGTTEDVSMTRNLDVTPGRVMFRAIESTSDGSEVFLQISDEYGHSTRCELTGGDRMQGDKNTIYALEDLGDSIRLMKGDEYDLSSFSTVCDEMMNSDTGALTDISKISFNVTSSGDEYVQGGNKMLLDYILVHSWDSSVETPYEVEENDCYDIPEGNERERCLAER